MKFSLEKRWLWKIVLIFFLCSVVLTFLFSDFMLDHLIDNTLVWYYLQTYRWFFFVIALTVPLYFLLRIPYK